VRVLDPASGAVRDVVEHRRGIGGVVRHRDGGVVVSGRNVAYKAPGRETAVLIANDLDHGVVGFNDITTDRQGRIYAGSLGFYPTVAGDAPRPGALHLIDLDGSVRMLAEPVLLTNGMGFSPDGTLLYHCDSGDQTVYVYDVDDDGSVADRRALASVKPGLPDGMAISDDGRIWVAVAHDGRVVVLAPDGSVDAEISFPVPMVTSLCFGGDDLRDLYVVTGSDGATGDAGTIYRLRSDVAGVPIAPASVVV
jgi:gluconolactonase